MRVTLHPILALGWERCGNLCGNLCCEPCPACEGDIRITTGTSIAFHVCMDTTTTPNGATGRSPKTERSTLAESTPAPVIAVGVVDDHPIVRRGVVEFLSHEDGIRVVGEAATANAALEMVRSTPMDVLILDLDMPGRSGLDMLMTLRGKAPDLAVLVFTGYPADRYAVKLLQQGVKAYLPKTCEPTELPLAIRRLAAGHRYLTPELSELIAQEFDPRAQPPHAGLTDRELQVLLKLARGVRTEKIADHLALSVKTVSSYRSRLLNKLSLGSNNDLTYYALKHQLLD